MKLSRTSFLVAILAGAAPSCAQDKSVKVATVDVSKIPDGAKNPEFKPVVAQIAGERGLTLVLEKGAGVLFADETVSDITTDVLRRLDARRLIVSWKAKDDKLFAEARKAPMESGAAHSLFDKGARAHDAKDYTTSLPAFKTVVYALYDSGERALVRLASGAAYNAACGCALDGRKEDALDWLEVAVGLGWLVTTDECHASALAHLDADKDLESIRGEGRYKEFVMRAKSEEK